jgi:hypothetical protein
VPAYQQFWTGTRSSLENEHKAIISTKSNSASSMQLFFNVLRDIEELASYTPASVGESEE